MPSELVESSFRVVTQFKITSFRKLR